MPWFHLYPKVATESRTKFSYTVQGQYDGRRLLVTGNKRTSLNTQKTCMAEDVCVSKTCGRAYDHTSKNLPFTVDYDKIRNGASTTFSFKVYGNDTAPSIIQFCKSSPMTFMTAVLLGRPCIQHRQS